MRSIKADDILGIRVWVDEENFKQANGFILNEKIMNSKKILEFKSFKELDDFIKQLKYYRKTMPEVV